MNTHYALDGYADVVEQLSGEFAAIHTYDAVTATVMKTHIELRRTTIVTSLYPLLDLSRHKLQLLPPTRPRT